MCSQNRLKHSTSSNANNSNTIVMNFNYRKLGFDRLEKNAPYQRCADIVQYIIKNNIEYTETSKCIWFNIWALSETMSIILVNSSRNANLHQKRDHIIIRPVTSCPFKTWPKHRPKHDPTWRLGTYILQIRVAHWTFKSWLALRRASWSWRRSQFRWWPITSSGCS